MSYELHLGDCRQIMAAMPANSVDSIVCDPPYGLSFMGKDWDHGVPGVPFWEAALRVAKPGAMLLAFGGTRTHHRLMVAIEDAGWEIRDCLMWLYGSGFPKGIAVDKAIDKARKEDVEAIRNVTHRLRSALIQSGKTRAEIDNYFGTANVSQYWFSPDRNPEVPPVERWHWLREFLQIGDELDAEIWRLNGRKGKPSEDWYKREVIGQTQYTNGGGNAYELRRGEKVTIDYDITAPATPEAAQWQGWHSSLKPSWEPIILAMKPLDGTYANNALVHGVAGLNVDGCRIGTSDNLNGGAYAQNGTHRDDGWGMQRGGAGDFTQPTGRWPANLILDEAAAALLDEQSGERKSGKPNGAKRNVSGPFLAHANGADLTGYGDTGGASRFFYVAKASSSERNEGITPVGGGNGVGMRNSNTHPT